MSLNGAYFVKLLTNQTARLYRRSITIPRALDRAGPAIAALWGLVFLAASLPRVILAPSPVHGLADLVPILLPYCLIALAPVVGYRLALASFPAGTLTAQPEIRLSRYGRWRRLSLLDVYGNPAFGPAGLMASLLIGLLLNVVLRSVEFLLAMPAVNFHAPRWSTLLFALMATDVTVLSFFYTVCFVLALRGVPLFPRMLLFTWLLDLTTQLVIAQRVAALGGLPPLVAANLGELLRGNVIKVLISMFVWLPYLILSERVNVTYRHRTGEEQTE